jgi:PPM family protein phosphatase
VSQVELHHGAASDVGLLRENNEDAYLVAPPVFVVADGMGGHENGDVASRIVVEEFARLAEEGYEPTRGPEVVTATLQASQRRIAEYAAPEGPVPRRTPGTTVVAALLVEDHGAPAWLLANLGDSRIYAVTGGELRQVSTDHSVVQELVDSGEITATEAHAHPERHVITRALGGPRLEPADFFVLPVTEVERLLLCSDGVSGLVDDDQIAAILTETPDPRDAADQLVAAALHAGGDDNATAVVVDVVGLVPDQAYDSERQRASLEQKLGALP